MGSRASDLSLRKLREGDGIHERDGAKMRLPCRVAAVCTLLLGTTAASAHHSFSPVYDGTRTATVSGVVRSFQLVNPHAMMSVEVVDGAGKVVQWTIEFPGRLNLVNGGWTDDSVAVGERITVTGNPTHTGSSRLSFVEIKRADGTMLRAPAADRI